MSITKQNMEALAKDADRLIHDGTTPMPVRLAALELNIAALRMQLAIPEPSVPACLCGRRATHEIHGKDGVTYQCCECYVRSGEPPADWHSECMRVYAEMKAENASHKERTL